MEGKRRRSRGRRGKGERKGWGQGDATTLIGGGRGGGVGILKERPDESTTARRDNGEAGLSRSSLGALWPAEEEGSDGDGDSMATGEGVP